MKIDSASSLRPSSLAASTATFSLPAFLRSKLRSRVVAVLILLLSGLQFQLYVPTALAQHSTGGKNGTAGKDGDAQQWSVQVDKVDPGNVIIERSFRDAIYENLLEELAKTKQFKQLYRSGDRNAKGVSTGQLKLRIERSYSLADAEQAHHDLNGRKTTGKLLLLP